MSGQPEAVQPASPVAAARVRPLRLAAVGVSTKEICGVRDYAALLADALGREGVSCSLHWLQRSGGSLLASRAEVRAWAKGLAAELAEEAAEAVLLHYSVFTYSYQGIPIFVGPVLGAASRARLPVVIVLHEFVFPWTLAGLTGKVWAISQRIRLIGVMNASTAGVVTTQQRAAWLQSRLWLPRRRLVVTPVFSNLPPANEASRPNRESDVIGLFGYSLDVDTVALILDSLRLLYERGLPVRLLLLGAPGAHSGPGERWLGLARERGVEQALSFSGTLPAQDLSDRLAGCGILLFADPIGPTSRKTTLAASLASGRPVVALDGPQRWAELIECEAARVVTPSAEALACALAGLLADERLRESLGIRGRDFAERTGLQSGARVVADLLTQVVDQQAARQRSHAERAL